MLQRRTPSRSIVWICKIAKDQSILIITRREERDAHRALQSRSIAQTILVEDKSKSPKIGLVITKLLEIISNPQWTHTQKMETPTV
jgi:hypothetical protein